MINGGSNMTKGVLKNIVIGLIVALSLHIVILSGNFISMSYAVTVDELKDFIDYVGPGFNADTRLEVDVLDKDVEVSESVTRDDVEAKYVGGSQVDVGELNSKGGQEELIRQLEDSLHSKMVSASADSVLDTLADLLNALDTLQYIEVREDRGFAIDYQIRLSDNTVLDIPLVIGNKSDIEELLDERVKEYKLDNPNYDIGGIGFDAISVVEGRYNLVMPWGFSKHELEEKYINSKLLGVELQASKGTNILSQWNGVVVGIFNIDSGSGLKIYHGNGLYTIYNYVKPDDKISVGSYVRAGSKIGESMGYSESALPGHIYYQMKINGVFVNPILIFGSSGKVMYEYWMKNYNYDNVVSKGEKYFNDKDYNYLSEDNYGDVIPLIPELNKDY